MTKGSRSEEPTRALRLVGAEQPALVLYDEMCRAIAEAYRVDEAKNIRDKAVAVACYARQANNHEAYASARNENAANY